MKKIALFFVLVIVATSIFAQIPEKDLKKCAKVKIETNYGIMVVALYNETPQHRDNFLKLVKEGYYDNVLFHRIIKDFMVQAGDPNSRDTAFTGMLGVGDIGYTVPAEIQFPEIYHKRGALCAARQSDQVNPERASSGCQFYIVQGKTFTDQELDAMQQRVRIMLDNQDFKYTDDQRLYYKTFGGTPHLDGGYTVFGELVKGFEVLDKLNAVQTGANDRPVEPVRIITMTIIKNFKK